MCAEPQKEAWNKFAEQEAAALAELLATDGRCVLVIVVGAESDEQGSTYVLHEVAGKTKGSHLRQFIAGVDRKLQFLKSKLIAGRG